MKKIVISIIFLLTFSLSKAQTNADIANVYIKRAIEAIENSIDFNTGLSMFKKAMKYTDTILNKKVASLGASIYFEVHHKQPTLKEQLAFLEKAKSYSAQYFLLTKSKKSEEYLNNTESYVFIQENIEILKAKIAKIETERLNKEKELRRIDSLKVVWLNKSNALSIEADSIYAFNKNNVALYKKGDFFGVINDVGEVLIKANEYRDALNFDGFIVFKNLIDAPTKLYSFNTSNKIGFLVPSISDYNTLSTHYGKVMLPRGNGRLVTYPNNSIKPFIYDLNVRKIVKVANVKVLLKNLKKAEVIGKYNKKDEVKLGKQWFNFGGHLGGGIHPLYAIEGYKLNGFLCSLDGRFLNAVSEYQYLGAFYKNKYQALKGNQIFWVNQNGTKVGAAKDEANKYSGNSIVNKLENGNYQITQEGVIILGKENLEKLPVFLRNFSKQN